MKKVIALAVIGVVFGLAAVLVYQKKHSIKIPSIRTEGNGIFATVTPGQSFDVNTFLEPHHMVYTKAGQPYTLRINNKEWPAKMVMQGWWEIQVYTSKKGSTAEDVITLNKPAKIYIVASPHASQNFEVWVAAGPMSAEHIRMAESGK